MNEIQDFRALGLSEEMLSALELKGFKSPSPIQALTIPKLLSGTKDLIGQAQTGTGKTAAFGIPIIENAEVNCKTPQALILAPTRELSMQIAEEINSFKGCRKLRIASFYGGQNIEVQLQLLRQGNVDIIIGTPGRIIDLYERGELDFSALKYAVLDEADEMLDMGFIEDIEKILSFTNPDKRMLMFSATMPPEVLSIAEQFMNEYEVIRTQMTQLSTELTDQIYYQVRREDKFDALMRIIDTEEDLYALVFCRTKGDVDEVVEKLKQHHYPVEALHGDVAQSQRTKVITRFKGKHFPLLVATDVAARGIDVNDLTHVINYSIPQSPDIYIHRVGRTGRAGKEGKAITFVTPGEIRRIRHIQQTIRNEIRKEELPDGRAVIELKKRRYVEKLAKFNCGEANEEYLLFARELLDQAYSAEELLAAILQNHFRDELLERKYRDFSGKKKDRAFWENSSGAANEVKLLLGVGKLDGFGAVKVMNLFRDIAHLRKNRVGKIDCEDHRTFVYLDNEDAKQAIAAFRASPGAPAIGYAPLTLSQAAPYPEKAAQKGADRPKRSAAPEKKRRTKNWEEKINADIELKERKKSGRSKAKSSSKDKKDKKAFKK
ncbi:MAG: DEAD/DEAH box helicase [Lentisphaerae bacterium]|nr:DEAD/DEAH box helicase [Lentisphaerota bacterium]